MFPGVDQNGVLVRESDAAPVHIELRIRAFDFQKHMALRMGMLDKGAVHIKECDPAERPYGDPERR